MPWEHCGRQIRDDERCPVCAFTKAAWTMRLGATRTFAVTSHSVSLRLVGAAGEPRPDELCEVTLASGKVKRLRLDGAGAIEVRIGRKKQTCTVAFPDLTADQVVVVEDPARAQGCVALAAAGEIARFECTPNQVYTFQVAVAEEVAATVVVEWRPQALESSVVGGFEPERVEASVRGGWNPEPVAGDDQE